MTIPAAVCGIPSLLGLAQSRPSHGLFSGEQLGSMLVWTVIILMVFLVASYAIHRFSRRFRAYLLRKPVQPTACDDVWKMHRLPESWDENQAP